MEVQYSIEGHGGRQKCQEVVLNLLPINPEEKVSLLLDHPHGMSNWNTLEMPAARCCLSSLPHMHLEIQVIPPIPCVGQF